MLNPLMMAGHHHHEQDYHRAEGHAHDEQALARTTPLHTKPGRYRPPDKLLAFLEAL
jgi:hypothetical protein